MSVTFIPNLLFEKEVALSPQVAVGVTTAAEAVATDARARAPVETGALRDSIALHAAEGSDMDVVAEVPYAVFVEFGTALMEAQPFLRPALEAVLGRE